MNMKLRKWKCVTEFCFCFYQNIKQTSNKYLQIIKSLGETGYIKIARNSIIVLSSYIFNHLIPGV